MPRPLPRLRHVLALPIPNLQRTQFPRLRPAPFSQRFATTTNTTTTTASPAASSFLPATPDNSFQKTAKAQRKARKDAHEEKDQGKSGGDGVLWNGISGHAGRWEVVCGLEIHAQLNTGRKLFSDAKTSLNETPNSHVGLFDAALPGSQPIFQPQTLLPALRAAIALNCEIMPESRFDRKHYFYWDQPGGYQITQFYHPLAKDGYIKLFPTDGIELGEGVEEMVVGIKQVQMEQDTAKTITTPSLDPMTTPSTHLIDLNRVSHPLIEVITTPCLPSSTHASLALRKLQSLLRASNAAIVGMEWGGLRCDVNVSVRPRGSTTLGQRCEIKNLFSIKVVEEAVEAEARRQVSVLENGGVVVGETRGWDGELGKTFRLRGKEGEVDYRYMPEPDVPPVRVGRGVVEWLRREMPELPDDMLGRLAREVKAGGKYGLTLKDANTLMAWDGGARVGYFEEVVAKVRRHLEVAGEEEEVIKDAGRVVGNWVIHELPANLTSANLTWTQNPVTTTHLADIISHLLLGKISGRTSKSLLPYIITTSVSSSSSQSTIDIPTYITENSLLLLPLSSSDLINLIKKVINEFGDMYTQYRSKKLGGLRNWFVGKVVREGEGRVDARRVERVVGGVLDGEGKAE
ncbi:hypothetical protein L211DRAFT_792877 [Terfezia boudieri ATCC MYA-4762]|uniref:Glutamyl-tRNA(Gln) amidotransferase subunit B, mitochondrial n=1 Tax=Terfezia boudieri ATCC MYA-4762 TaxID=1051890 RepID=A0A3N4LF58_9PEZI|nr:hypothetical protein L211DRAFT_792877 [Terfezia boudieri ATCC MYA-4762]